MQGQRVGGGSVLELRMKPSIDPKALRAAVLVAVPILIGVLEVLQAAQGKVSLTDPALWIKLIQIVAAGLFGKEVLVGSDQVRVSQLPVEWQRNTEPPQ